MSQDSKVQLHVLGVAGAAVALGWGLHDLATLATSGSAVVALDLIPGLLRAVLIAGALSALALHNRWLSLLLLGAAVILWLQPGWLAFDPVTPAERRLGQMAFYVVLAACGVAALLRRRSSATIGSAALLGLCTGALFAVVHTALHVDRSYVSTPVVLATLCALPWALAIPKRWLPALAVAGLPIAGIMLTRDVRETEQIARTDQPPIATDAVSSDLPNLILIILDTARADRMGTYGYERDTTPELDRFTREHATRYENARSTASWTLPSHASLFTGQYPAVHGVTIPRQGVGDEAPVDPKWIPPNTLDDTFPTLAERLGELGLHTVALVSNAMAGAWSGLDRGFERYDDRAGSRVRAYQALGQIGGRGELAGHKPYRDAREMTDLALDWIEEERRPGAPFFLFLNYMDVHNPYCPPPPFDTAFEPDVPRNKFRPEIELWSLLYDREFAYLDSEVGRFLDSLDRELFDNSLIVITSDHGEAFGEHDTWIHGWGLHEELVRVPLLIKPAFARIRESVDRHVTSADVHDLILAEYGIIELDPVKSIAGHVAERYYSPVNRMLPGLPGKTQAELAYDELSWIEDGVKFHVSSEGGVEAFDLATDPEEKQPLSLSADAKANAIERAREWWSSNPPPERAESELDAERLEGLRQLGYTGEDT